MMVINLLHKKIGLKFLLILIKCIIIINAESINNIIKTGAVLSIDGKTASTMEDAYRGYKIFIDRVNELNDGKGMDIPAKKGTPVYYLKFDFERRNDNSDHEEHDKQVIDLLDNEKIHFLFGSHSEYASNETYLTNDRDIYNLHCCVGPDSFYEKAYKYVFGISVSNVMYTNLLMKILFLEGVKTMGIAYESSNKFTKTTCEAARDYAFDYQVAGDIESVQIFESFNHKSEDRDVFMKNFAKKAKEENVEAVIGCFMEDDGKIFVNALHDIEFPIKALFLTVGPTNQEWVESFGQNTSYRTDNLLSAGQWHKELDLKDEMFGTTHDYVELYQHTFNVTFEPTYISAAASATGYVLYDAFQHVFKNCDLTLTKGDVNEILLNPKAIICDDGDLISGYDRIRTVLKGMDIEIFFGRIKFNQYQRNMGLDPVTTQVFHKEKDGEIIKEINAVLPLESANSVLNFPAKNYYKEDCVEGYFKSDNEFDSCFPCNKGERSSTINADHCESCQTGYWSGDYAQKECKKCPDGTTTISIGSISLYNCTCIRGYYHPNGDNMGHECSPCPIGAICEGGKSLPYPLPGYWSAKDDVTVMHKCDPIELCLGGPNSTCSEGYSGRLCAECEEGYFSLFEQCRPCIGTGGTIMMIIALVFGWYLINVTVSRNVASLEMILSWAQLANIIGDVDLDWPMRLNDLFGIANILDFDVDILEPSCMISWSFTQNLIVQLLLPFLMSGMAAFGFFSSCVMYKLSKLQFDKFINFSKNYLSWLVRIPDNDDELKERWDKTLATFLASVEITYVTICKYCFDVFKCETIDGVSVLSASPDIECGTKGHTKLQIYASLGILFYIILYVVFISYKLYSLNYKNCFSEPAELRRFGFVYHRFELDYYYTPVIILVRRLIFVTILVFLNNPAFQAGAMAVVINASLMIHVYTAPYIDTYLDVLFSFLLIALMFEAFGGLMFSSNLLSGRDRDILEWIVLFTFFILVIVFLVIFLQEIRKIYHVNYLKKLHLQIMFQRKFHDDDDLSANTRNLLMSSLPFSNVRSFNEIRSQVNFELLDTFDPEFIYNAIKNDKSLMLDWDKLTNLLADYMGDRSETSYLSMSPIAKFWRKLVDRFPELVDFLAVSDDETRESFRKFATNLYKNFYLTNKVIKLPIFSVLNWRDYGPMAHWLALSSNEDRRFLVTFMISLFRASKQDEIANTLQHQLENGGKIDSVKDFSSRRPPSAKMKRALLDIQNDITPLDHSSLEKFKNTINIAKNISHFANVLKSKASRTKEEMNIENPQVNTDSHEGSSAFSKSASSSYKWNNTNSDDVKDKEKGDSFEFNHPKDIHADSYSPENK